MAKQQVDNNAKIQAAQEKFAVAFRKNAQKLAIPDDIVEAELKARDEGISGKFPDDDGAYIKQLNLETTRLNRGLKQVVTGNSPRSHTMTSPVGNDKALEYKKAFFLSHLSDKEGQDAWRKELQTPGSIANKILTGTADAVETGKGAEKLVALVKLKNAYASYHISQGETPQEAAQGWAKEQTRYGELSVKEIDKDTKKYGEHKKRLDSAVGKLNDYADAVGIAPKDKPAYIRAELSDLESMSDRDAKKTLSNLPARTRNVAKLKKEFMEEEHRRGVDGKEAWELQAKKPGAVHDIVNNDMPSSNIRSIRWSTDKMNDVAGGAAASVHQNWEEGQFSKLNSAVGGLAGKVDGIAGKVDGVQTRLGQAETKLFEQGVFTQNQVINTGHEIQSDVENQAGATRSAITKDGNATRSAITTDGNATRGAVTTDGGETRKSVGASGAATRAAIVNDGAATRAAVATDGKETREAITNGFTTSAGGAVPGKIYITSEGVRVNVSQGDDGKLRANLGESVIVMATDMDMGAPAQRYQVGAGGELVAAPITSGIAPGGQQTGR